MATHVTDYSVARLTVVVESSNAQTMPEVYWQMNGTTITTHDRYMIDSHRPSSTLLVSTLDIERFSDEDTNATVTAFATLSNLAEGGVESTTRLIHLRE